MEANQLGPMSVKWKNWWWRFMTS